MSLLESTGDLGIAPLVGVTHDKTAPSPTSEASVNRMEGIGYLDSTGLVSKAVLKL